MVPEPAFAVLEPVEGKKIISFLKNLWYNVCTYLYNQVWHIVWESFMKKIVFFAMLCAALLCFASCSGGVTQKTDISVNIPKEVIQTVADEAARAGEISDDAKCNIICLLYVDGWAEAYADDWQLDDQGNVIYPSDRHYYLKKDLEYKNIQDVKFTYPDIYVGAKIQAQVIIICGNISYSGLSKEEDLTEDGASLHVEVSKDKRKITIENEEIKELKEIQLPDPTDDVDKYGNEYWLFTVPEENKEFAVSWFLDGKRQNGTDSTLKVYKALLSKGEHIISCSATGGNETCAGEKRINVNVQPERVALICTEKGFEFRVNRFDSDIRFDSLQFKDNGTGLILNCDVPGVDNSGYYGWTGCWPFVEPGKDYSFIVGGNWGEQNKDDNGDLKFGTDGKPDCWKEVKISMKYYADSTNLITDNDWDYINTINNYTHDKRITAVEKNNGTTDNPDINYYITLNQTEKNEVYNLFKDSGLKISSIRAEMQIMKLVRNNPNDPNDLSVYDDWFHAPSVMMYETGTRRSINNCDFKSLLGNDDQKNFMEKWNAYNSKADGWYLRIQFFYKIQGLPYQSIKVNSVASDDIKLLIPPYTTTQSN